MPLVGRECQLEKARAWTKCSLGRRRADSRKSRRLSLQAGKPHARSDSALVAVAGRGPNRLWNCAQRSREPAAPGRARYWGSGGKAASSNGSPSKQRANAFTSISNSPSVRSVCAALVARREVCPLGRAPRPCRELEWHAREVTAVAVDLWVELALHRTEARLFVNRSPAPVRVLADLDARHDWPTTDAQVRASDRLPPTGTAGRTRGPVGGTAHRVGHYAGRIAGGRLGSMNRKRGPAHAA
jgi:hypothetical protein